MPANKIAHRRRPHVAFVGLGKIGLPLAINMPGQGNQVSLVVIQYQDRYD